jgi:hypothetical protein
MVSYCMDKIYSKLYTIEYILIMRFNYNKK